MNKKIYIIAVLAIIITTLSQTVSIISGEHQFYQNVQDKCTKCHGDIKAQLSNSANHSSDACNFCHVKSVTNHTNTNPACQDCHNTTQKLNDSLEAHTDFSSMGSKGCIACHTTYNTLMNYSRAEYIDYTITNNNGNWVISNITTTGTLNLSYNAQRKGGDHDIQNVSCKDCHEDIFEAVSLGGHAVVLAKNSTNITNGTQVPYHDNSNMTLEAWCRTCHNRNDANFSTQQHSVRKTTCEECHQAYNLTPHPGNFFTNINTVPHLYRSLVCISCHSIGWPAPSGGIHFKVHQEPYFDVTYEIIAPLLITNSTPAGDPTTTAGTAQTFSITLNRAADIYWYNNGSEIFRALSVISSSYTNSNAGIGVYNITAVAYDGSATVSRIWNWTVTNQTVNGTGAGGGGGIVPGGGVVTGSATGTSGSNNISGYVFDNNVLALPDVLVQSGSYQNTTNISGYYSITNLSSGTYNFSYSKAGFNTGYSLFTLNGASVENVNVIIYDTTPPASVSNISMVGGNFYINNTWANPADADFNYTWFRYDNGTTLQNINKSTDYLNLTWSPHYTQNISSQTVDTYNNINPTPVWFNATVPNNAPVQLQIGNKTVDEGQLLNFTVSATDADNDTITYGTNATKGDFNSTTGNFSWIPTYGDAGIYNWYFNSSDNYGGISTENIAVTVNNVPLSVINSSPVSDPVTAKGTAQRFEISLNRTADIIWYNNGYEVFRFLGVTSSSYANSSADAGIYNITAVANDGYDSVSRTWSWNVTAGSGGSGADMGSGSGGSGPNNISGYVFDNYGSKLPGVLVLNGSYQNATDASGYYSISDLPNGTYNFSYSMNGFSTAYFEFTLNGAVVINANRTLYDIMPTTSISNPSMTTGNFYVNNTWVNPVDPDFNYTWFRYSNDTTLQNVSKPVNYLNLTWSPHYTQNISAQTVDTSGNVNQTKVWFNTTIPNNAPFQYAIGNKVVNENENLQFNVTATDIDNDTLTYGTNATKGTFNTTTGNFSWTPSYGDAGFYYWNFNSSDGYGGIANENIAVTVISVPLSITSSSPATDPTTTNGTIQTFGITLNRTANVTWYLSGSAVQANSSVTSANYTNSTAGVGVYNITAVANDGYYSASREWNWTVVSVPTYNVSGYVFDNYGSGLGGALVQNIQNSSYQNTTLASGYYLITGLINGTYNFSYSKADFNTGYLNVTIDGSDNTTANTTLYDTTPPASVSNASMATGNFFINNTWTNPIDADFNYTWFRYSNGTNIQNVSKPANYLNLTWSPHYTQNISAQTVDAYGNVNQTMVWFNITIPDNPPVQTTIGNQTVYEGQWLNFTVNATDADNDTVTYGTNATNGTLNTTTGNFSWLTTYADAGVYFWYFNSSDGYGGIANENMAVTVINVPLSITSSSPVSDLTTTNGTIQTFGITLNRTANVTWYMDGSIAQANSSVVAANYTNSTAGVGVYNLTAVANDSYDSAITTWNWTITPQTTYNVSGYVFDNYGSGLGGVLVQNGNYQNTTLASGYYLITGLFNGTYNFSYSKADFNTDYLEVTINSTDNTTANRTIYDTTPPASVSNPNTTTGNFYINNSWVNPADIDFNYTWFRYSNGTNIQNVSEPTNFLNLTWSPHYTQNISAQTVDNYGNINQTIIWFNATIPDNPPAQTIIGNQTVNEGQWLNFTVNATDADNDTISYGSDATKGTFNTTTGNYSWLTNYGDAGVYIWYFNSSDGYGGVAKETITVTVNSVPLSITNSSPASDPITTNGIAQTFAATLNRTADVTWYMNGSVVQTNSSVASANYTNSSAGVGIYNVTAVANDSYYSASRIWNWTVNSQPVYAPSITSWSNSKTNNNSPTLAVNTSESVNFNATANQTITTWNWYQDGVNQNNNYDNFTTSWSTAGIKTIQVNATNSNGTSNTITWNITVQAQPVAYTPPPPANINSSTGNFWVNTTWQPGAGNTTDSYNVSVNGTWNNGTTSTYVNSSLSAHAWQNVTVYAFNASGTGSLSEFPATNNTQIPDNPPVQAPIGAQAANEGQWLNFTVNATDPDNDTITYGTNATGGSFNATTGDFSWLTTYSDAGTYIWYFNSSDGYGGVASETITVTVNNVPLSVTSFSPPSDPTTTQGTAQTFNLALNRTANITWYMNGTQVQTNTSTTSADYTNSTAGTGTWNVTASVTDGIDTASRAWNWTVNALPSTTYIPADPTNLQNTTGNFWVNNTWQAGSGNNIDSYNVSVNGTWYNSTTNAYYNNSVGPHGWSNVTVWAYNSSGTGSLSSGSLSQNTQVPNNPPIQSPIGTKTINEGQPLNFTVSATDLDNDTITYGTNATKGTLNTTTGQFSWTPSYGDAGVYIWYFNSSDGYGGVASETIILIVNSMPLSVTNSLPVSDPTTTVGTAQTFSISLNRTADVTWYMNGSVVQTNSSVASANYTNSSAGVGIYDVTAIANDGYYSASKQWNWSVVSTPKYNVSGYVFDNYGSVLGDVRVQNGSYQSNTSASGYYLITGLLNGTYNFSYSKAGFNTGYLEVTINGADNTTANITIYDTTPPASISNIAAASTALYINWTWIDPIDSDFDHAMVYIDGTFMRNITKGVQFYNASYFMPNSTHTISTLTVDTYGNVNATWVNNTAATLPDYMYVSSFQNDTGTVSDFSNAMSASDGGASATFTEANVSGVYLLNITTNTTDIPAAGVQTLQLMYNVSGDNFTLQIWNGSVWNDRTTLNDTSPSYRNITLMPEELIPEGAYTGPASSISSYYVLVRYLDLNASAAQQGNLYLDYQRVHNE